MPNPASGICAWLTGFGGRHPLFLAALVTAVGVILADRYLVLGLAAVFCLAIFCARFWTWKWALTWLFCGWMAAGVMACRDGVRVSAEHSLLSAPAAWAQAEILKDGRGSERFWYAPARLLDGPGKGNKVMWEGRGELPVAGSIVRARGDFNKAPGPRNPGEFPRDEWLERQGVAAVFQTGWVDGEVETGKLAALGARIRQGFRKAVTDGLEENSLQAAVIRAVVIGEQPPDAEDLIAEFRNSGTLHVFSVSGLHVAMVGSMGWLLLGWAGVPRRWAVPALLPLVFGYSWITGNSAPAVRSAWMAAVFLGAFSFRRKPDLLNALGAVLLAALLWDGRLLFQPGVQLSYGVVAAIAIGTGWASRSFAWMATPELYLPERHYTWWQKRWYALRRATAQSMSVSLAAGVGSAPLTAFHFGLVTPVSVIAGLVLVPLVYGVLAASLCSVALYPVLPTAARLLNRANGVVADLCVHSARAFAAIPGGHWQVGRETRPLLLVYDLGYGAGAACFSAGNEGAVFIDCGDRRGFKRIVAPSLRTMGIEPDSVVFSHPDGNHLGGGEQVWNAFPIRQALMPVQLSRSPAYRSWMESAPDAGVALHFAKAGSSMKFPDDARLEILHHPDSLAKNSLADERVAVFRLRWRGWKLLFTNDAGMGTELKLLDAGKDVSADVIIAGRHRTDLSLCDRFLDAVRPSAIVTANPPHPIEEKVPAKTMDYWRKRGIHVIDQAESGGVTLSVDENGGLRIAGFLSSAPLLLTPR